MNIPRQQRFIVIGALGKRQSLERVAQPCVRLFAVGFGRLNERINLTKQLARRRQCPTGWLSINPGCNFLAYVLQQGAPSVDILELLRGQSDML